MRPLRIDFRRRHRRCWTGWALLGVGMLATASALLAEREISAATASELDAVRRAERALPAPARMRDTRQTDRGRALPIAELQRIQAQLALPWGALFATLESLASPDVALLALAPDTRKRQVRLTAEGRDLDAMLAFHRKLEDSAPMRDVSLLNHEFLDEMPGRPVRFALSAEWVIDDAHP